MAFKLGDIVIDRIQFGLLENSKGVISVLTQLSEATINTTAESVDAVDARGTLVKRFYRAKTCEFTATNAMNNLSLIAAAGGTDPEVASEEAKIAMPKIITVKKGGTATLTNFVDGTVLVYGFSGSGTLGDPYEKGDAATTDKYALTEDGDFTPPTADGVDSYIVKYMREVSSGVAIRNVADKFPGNITLTLKVLAVDPCAPDEVRAGYIEMKSFEPSSDLEFSLSTEGTMNFSGSAAVDYCSPTKELYSFYWADDDVEE